MLWPENERHLQPKTTFGYTADGRITYPPAMRPAAPSMTPSFGLMNLQGLQQLGSVDINGQNVPVLMSMPMTNWGSANLLNMASKNIVQAEDEDDFDRVIATQGKLVVVDFYADWCAPCMRIAPQFASIASQLGNEVVFAKVDIDENDDAAFKAGISAMPTFQFYRNGKKIDEIKGANIESVKAKINQLK